MDVPPGRWRFLFSALASRFDNEPLLDGASLEELLGDLPRLEIGPKDGPAIIPAKFSGFRRCNADVQAITALVADLDHLRPGELEGILERLSRSGITHVWWHTHSHTASYPKARILIPFLTELPVKEPRDWSEDFWPNLMAHFGFQTEGVDQNCKDPCRLYYLPRKPHADSLHQAGSFAGELFDWRNVLGNVDTLPHHPRRQGARVELPPESSEPVDFERLRARLLCVQKPTSRRLMRALLRGEVPVTGGHDNALLQVAGVMAGALWLDVPEAAVLELVRPALAKWNWPDGDLEFALGQFLEKFRRARLWAAQMEAERASYDASLAEFKATFGGLR